MAEAAEAAAWKARLRHRVASAERNSVCTAKHMVDVFLLLQAGAAEGAEAGAADGTAAGARHRLDLALDSLKLAAGAEAGAADGTAAGVRHSLDLALDSLKLAAGAEAGAADGTAAGARHSLDLALGSLKLAAGAASLAAADMLAARLAGLRGASPNPAQPISSVDEIRDTEVRTALQALRGAYQDADEAFHLIKVCAAHLSTVQMLLSYGGMDEIVPSERDFAITAFSRASQMVELFLVEAAYASEVLSAAAPADP